MTPHPPLTPPSDNAPTQPIRQTLTQIKAKQPFSEEDIESLLESAESIENIDPAKDAEAWNAWAETLVRYDVLA